MILSMRRKTCSGSDALTAFFSALSQPVACFHLLFELPPLFCVFCVPREFVESVSSCFPNTLGTPEGAPESSGASFDDRSVSITLFARSFRSDHVLSVVCRKVF